MLWEALAFASAQHLKTIGKEIALRETGRNAANQIFFAASGIESRCDPLSYFHSGKLNSGLYWEGRTLFLLFLYPKLFVQQPFNQYDLNSIFTKITGHVGFISMNFSPYTLSGHLFKRMDGKPNVEKCRPNCENKNHSVFAIHK